MSTDDSRALARRIIDQLDQRNLDGVIETAAPDARWHGFMSPSRSTRRVIGS